MPKDIIDLPLQGRMASVRADSVDEAARTVEILWTSCAAVRRARFWDGAVGEDRSLDGSAAWLECLRFRWSAAAVRLPIPATVRKLFNTVIFTETDFIMR